MNYICYQSRKNTLKYMQKRVLFFILLLTSSFIFGQETPTIKDSEEQTSKWTAAVDVVYPYLWRGLKYNADKLAFQPYVNYNITEKLTFGLWATTNFTNDADAYNEVDWVISYQISDVVQLVVSDYYWPSTKKAFEEDSANSRANYFDYSEGSAQSLDFSILLDFSEKGVPLDLQWNTLFGGNDYKYDENGVATGRAYSSYAEVGYTHTFEKAGIDVRPFIGAAIINGGYYGTDANGKAGFTFTNVGINIAKDIEISKNYTIPVFVRYSFNDYGVQKMDGNNVLQETERHFISAGLTFTIM